MRLLFRDLWTLWTVTVLVGASTLLLLSGYSPGRPSPYAPMKALCKAPEGNDTRRVACFTDGGNPRTASFVSSGRAALFSPSCSLRYAAFDEPECAGRTQSLEFVRTDSWDGRNSRWATVLFFDELCNMRAQLPAEGAAADFIHYYDSSTAAAGGPEWLPLGARSEFAYVPAGVAAAAARTAVFTFYGALSTNFAARGALMDALRQLKMDEAPRFLVAAADEWRANPAEGDDEDEDEGGGGGYVSPRRYREAMLSSTFALCPAGRNPEAFRVYEALEAGAIPVLLRRPPHDARSPLRCRGSLDPLSRAPVVWLDSWFELPRVVAMHEAGARDTDGLPLAAWRAECRRYYESLMRDAAARLERAVLGKAGAGAGAGAGERLGPLVLTGPPRSGHMSAAELLERECQAPRVSLDDFPAHPAGLGVGWPLLAAPGADPLHPAPSAGALASRAFPGPRVAGVLVRHPLAAVRSIARCLCHRGSLTRADAGESRDDDRRLFAFADRVARAAGRPLPPYAPPPAEWEAGEKGGGNGTGTGAAPPPPAPARVALAAALWLHWTEMALAALPPGGPVLRVEDQATAAALAGAAGVPCPGNGSALPAVSAPRSHEAVRRQEAEQRAADADPRRARARLARGLPILEGNLPAEAPLTWADLAAADESTAARVRELGARLGYAVN